jgi:streptomycin 6-kinase
VIPEPFRAAVSAYRPEGDGESGADWLRRLPRLVEELLEQWGLSPDGASRYGACALVLPVTDGGRQAMLKVTWPHGDARHEHLALRAWDGQGAVRLLAADPARWALLLERLDADRDLATAPIDTAGAVIGDLLRRLDRPALPQLARLSGYARRQVRDVTAAPHGIPRRLLDRGAGLARDLAADEGVDARLVHTDLHYANVLAAPREPWLAIDPKPMAADPAFAVAPMLWNRWGEVLASGDARRHLRRRLSIVCEHAGIDEGRARAWAIVRAVDNALADAGRGPGGADGVTTAVTVIKAMSD